jgi:hypothetical protein
MKGVTSNRDGLGLIDIAALFVGDHTHLPFRVPLGLDSSKAQRFFCLGPHLVVRDNWSVFVLDEKVDEGAR